MTVAGQHATPAFPQREHVARPHDAFGTVGRVDRNLDRTGPVTGRDAGRDPFGRFDRDGEVGLADRHATLGERLETQLVAAVGR